MPFYFTPAMTAYVLALAFALGACAGSFLECAAGRSVRGESALRGRSRCDGCGRTLELLDLIPILSWLFLKGRCRSCGAKIGARCVVTESLCGCVFASVLWRFGFSWICLELLILGCALVYLSLVDLESMELPGAPMAVAAGSFLLFLFAHGDPLRRLWWGLLGAAAIGGSVLLVSLIGDRVLGRETMGGGDIKLLALLGLYVGPDGGLLLVIAACAAGLAFAGLSRVGRGKEFPFGPAIALAAWPTLLFGERILEWYWSLF